MKKLLLLILVITTSSLRADENYFGYTYGAETLPKGHGELYQWVTFRNGKADGSYRAVDLQTEIEYGFTDRLQGSFYLNAIQHVVSHVPGFTDRDQFRFNGVQASLKYNAKSPYKDGYGLALYVEPGYKRYSRKSGKREDIFFFETKLITQKNYLEDTLVWATNLSAELEREHDLVDQVWETELELELSTGLSYRIAPRWFVGAEAVARSAFERAHLNQLGKYAIFLGPNIHYASARWWFTLTALPQVTGWPANGGERNLNNFEKLEVRLKIGLNF
ncbi:MAG: hypothetical protein HYV95_09590 [Opitutae bacterium]|nr:hypothetical protein [Opitutae bacterium]